MLAIRKGAFVYLRLTQAELGALLAVLRFYLARNRPAPADDAAHVSRMLAGIGKGAP